MRDMMNHIHTAVLFPPVAAGTDNTPIVSNIIDTLGYDSVTLALAIGTNTDADATFAVTMEHGDASNLSDTAAPASTDLIGTLALASFTFADDGETRKLGYVGQKRYVRMTITPSGNGAGNIFVAGLAILGHPTLVPTANPPQ